MFLVITKENIDDFPSCFLSLEIVKKNLDQNPFGKYLLYQEGKEVFGYLYYSEIYERVEIEQFEVEKSKRNQGIGNRILKEFTKTVEKDITLEVREDNEKAIHLYEKYGFVKKAIRKNYYRGKDGILMERISSLC